MSTRTDTIQRFMAGFAAIKRAMYASVYANHTTLSPSQIEVLSHLAMHTDMTVKQIANTLRITPSAVTQLIEPLVKEGCVFRNTDLSDRRSVNLHISPTGKKDLEKVNGARMMWMETLVEPLTDNELENLVQLIEKLAVKKKEK